jgi:hypothetical protein
MTVEFLKNTNQDIADQAKIDSKNNELAELVEV